MVKPATLTLLVLSLAIAPLASAEDQDGESADAPSESGAGSNDPQSNQTANQSSSNGANPFGPLEELCGDFLSHEICNLLFHGPVCFYQGDGDVGAPLLPVTVDTRQHAVGVADDVLDGPGNYDSYSGVKVLCGS